MSYISGIQKPAQYSDNFMAIESYKFKEVCVEANYEHEKVVALLARDGYVHDGSKYWSLQNYIDLANGLTVRNATWPS